MGNKSLIYIPSNADFQKKINFQPIHDELIKASNMNPVQYNEEMSEKFKEEGVIIESLCNFPEEIAAIRVFIPKNKIIDKHFHGNLKKEYLEIVFCKKGNIIIYFDSDDKNDYKEIHENDYCIIPPGEIHSLKSLEDCILICATIPADINYPLLHEE